MLIRILTWKLLLNICEETAFTGRKGIGRNLKLKQARLLIQKNYLEIVEGEMKNLT